MRIQNGVVCADWWSQSDFVLNELNVQSVVTAPAHDEMIPLAAKGNYTVKGFAYSGMCYWPRGILPVTAKMTP